MLGTAGTDGAGTPGASCAVAVGCVPAVRSASSVGHAVAEAAGDGEPLVIVELEAIPGLVVPPGAVPVACAEVPVLAGVPLPSVPAPPVCCPPPPPPLSTVVLAAMMAWRKGCTPSETLAMTAIPASTATGRSQPAPVAATARAGRLVPGWLVAGWLAGAGSRRSRGQGRAACEASPAAAPGHAHAQWPRQVQCLARP